MAMLSPKALVSSLLVALVCSCPAVAGIKSGIVHGSTDEFGWHAIQDKVHVHDLHATILHLMGLDHERLTYRYSGRDYRLTDVYRNVVHDIIA
jgi:hypothetical protein